MDRFASKQKAIDLALWRNHNHRYDSNYGITLSSMGDFLVLQKDHSSFRKEDFETLPLDYAQMTYQQIKQIAMDTDPFNHWEEVRGFFSRIHGETLRFILKMKVPLEKFIRYELACRGYDEDFEWVGFDKAEEIWLK